MIDTNLQQMRERITILGKLMFDRFLTDIAGGNISARVGDQICITPRYAGSRNMWHLQPQQVLVVDLDGNQLDGEGEISRESKVHLRLYKDFPEAQGIIHAHPRNVMVFVAARESIPSILESTRKFGGIKVTPAFAPAHSIELANLVAVAMRGQEEQLRAQAAIVIARWHGIFSMGKTIEAALDAVERIDLSAYILLYSQGFPNSSELANTWHAALEEDVLTYQKTHQTA
jgi:L-fuculose-phosphate aldolase